MNDDEWVRDNLATEEQLEKESQHIFREKHDEHEKDYPSQNNQHQGYPKENIDIEPKERPKAPKTPTKSEPEDNKPHEMKLSKSNELLLEVRKKKKKKRKEKILIKIIGGFLVSCFFDTICFRNRRNEKTSYNFTSKPRCWKTWFLFFSIYFILFFILFLVLKIVILWQSNYRSISTKNEETKELR